MTEVGRYFSYEEANGWRLELLAAGVECRVDYQSRGLSFMGGNSTIYTISVEEGDVERALNVIAHPEVEDHVSLLTCPRCGSNDVMEMRSLGKLPAILRTAITHEGAKKHQLYCGKCKHGWDVT